jgi:hypothetical protein
MKLKFLQATVIGLMLSICNIANAGLIGSTIWKPGVPATTFDLWYFTANTSTDAVFDIVSWGEGDASNYHGGDYMINSMIWLLRNDGILDNNSILASNDDFYDLALSGTDGSISHFDSYISMNLFAGDYVLIVGTVDLAGNTPSFSDLDFTSKMQDKGTVYHYDGIGHTSDNISYGDYGLTYTGVEHTLINPVSPVSSVPEPSTLAIFALGIMGLAARRFKKQ